MLLKCLGSFGPRGFLPKSEDFNLSSGSCGVLSMERAQSDLMHRTPDRPHPPDAILDGGPFLCAPGSSLPCCFGRVLPQWYCSLRFDEHLSQTPAEVLWLTMFHVLARTASISCLGEIADIQTLVLFSGIWVGWVSSRLPQDARLV